MVDAEARGPGHRRHRVRVHVAVGPRVGRQQEAVEGRVVGLKVQGHAAAVVRTRGPSSRASASDGGRGLLVEAGDEVQERAGRRPGGRRRHGHGGAFAGDARLPAGLAVQSQSSWVAAALRTKSDACLRREKETYTVCAAGRLTHHGLHAAQPKPQRALQIVDEAMCSDSGRPHALYVYECV